MFPRTRRKKTSRIRKIPLYKRSKFVAIGTKNKLKQYEFHGEPISPYESDYIKPQGKFWKRVANKRIRKSFCFNGGYYRKVYGWFHWS